MACFAALIVPSARPAKAAGQASDVPEEVRNGIDPVLKEKVKKLLDEKDANGQPFKRGSWSKNFRKVDDSTWLVAFHRDTASPDRLRTERFELKLAGDKSGKWTVASEELKDSYDNLFRRVPGDEQFAKFGRFSFDREGMKISASGGSLFKDFRNGRIEHIVMAAGDIRYEYLPPEKKFVQLYDKLKKDRAADVLFDPEYVEIECDPQSCDELLKNAFSDLAPATLDSVDAKLKDKYEEEQRDLKKERKDNPFGGFRRPEDEDHRYSLIGLAKDSPKRRVGLEYDNWEPREVGYWAFGLDKVFSSWQKVYHYYSEATRAGGTNARELEYRDDPEARFYDLTALKGTVDMALEDVETLTADLTYTMKTKREMREIPYFIIQLRRTEDEKKDIKDPQLTISSIEDERGNEMTWVKTGSSSGIVVLPEKVPGGTPVTLRVQFENKAGIYAVTPTFSYVSRFGWMPFVRFTDPISDFDLTIRVPARYKALGIGKKVSDAVADGVRTTRWIADSPVEFPSVIFGDYLSVESTVKATKKDGTPIPVWIHVDKLGKTPGAEKQLETLADFAANSLNFYRDIFGVDYPYGKLDLVNDPFGSFYGQSPSSLIYLGNGVFLGDAKAGALLESGSISKFNREVVPHEVGHQWWGSLIPNSNNGNYWFVESLAEYGSAAFVEASEGKPAYQEKIAEWRRRVLESDLQSSIQDASVLWSGSMYRGYTAAVYNKGPYVFHMMRVTWGDEKFLPFLKSLTNNLRNRPIVTRDIQLEAEKAFGGNMEFFFDQWIRGVGMPEFTFTYSVRQTEDRKYLIEGQVDQRALVGQKKDLLPDTYFTAIVPITVKGKTGKEFAARIKVQGPTTPFKFKVEDEPSEVTLNKYGECLAYDVIVKKK